MEQLNLILLLAIISSCQGLRCYICTNCPTVSNATPTTTCQDTTVLGVNLPATCSTTTQTTSSGDVSSVIRSCISIGITGCIDTTALGIRSETCYCTSPDLCNNDDKNSGDRLEGRMALIIALITCFISTVFRM